LPVGTEALAVICPHLIDDCANIFSFCTREFARVALSPWNAEKWVIEYKKMSI